MTTLVQRDMFEVSLAGPSVGAPFLDVTLEADLPIWPCAFAQRGADHG